ncbi:NADP-dependent oxidoreductase [Actinotalea sp. M2MS4P-6]|uniref:NADP-dependent oxidoreductase n=1 Tax=Actinotalea sp. M2MS4P-6 TaxID=2983762 RepID=UPI0021E3AC0A|nr:NADP-dependent oxidoreductase [Actinotalea sp. M2MS4P-6]MCV2394395.1 NADP-dependent oxidoreductase [Actinotalea sp. M2MS4P-6]
MRTIPTRMQAVVMDRPGGPEVLSLAEIDVPRVLPGDVLVEVHAAGVNPVDWKTRAGAPTPPALAFGPPPHVLGWDVAGVVVEVGPGVYRFDVGDRVFGMPWFPRPAGAYAEYVAAPARQLVRVPEGVGFVEAGAVPLAGLTAWQALTEVAGVRAGQRVLVQGAGGGVGHLAVQILVSLGAHVVGTARAANHDWLRSLGAHELVDYTQTSVAAVTAPVDVALDLAGGSPETVAATLAAIRDGGTYVPIGPCDQAAARAVAAERGVRVTTGMLVAPDEGGLQELARLMTAGALHARVARTYPLADAAAAHRDGATSTVAGKLVLEVRH